ncbi:hypothetical protein T484DRAFT_1756771 [Baffinella frigidus]|nr:hypothetical protein T484DRAFT_1756771 [Cryptophyta sp. CCMP2293]
MASTKKRISKKTATPRLGSTHRNATLSVEAQWPPAGAVQHGPYVLTAGEYWVGDLSTVLSGAEWGEVGDTEGSVTLKNGRTVVAFKLPEGSGIYPGKDRHNHLIESGMVGITTTAGLPEEARVTGQIIDYTNAFSSTSITVAHPQGGGDVSFNTFGPKIEIDSDDQIYSTAQFFREAVSSKHR